MPGSVILLGVILELVSQHLQCKQSQTSTKKFYTQLVKNRKSKLSSEQQIKTQLTEFYVQQKQIFQIYLEQ